MSYVINKGEIKNTSVLTRESEAGLNSLLKKKKDGKAIIGLTDKSGKYYAIPEDNFKKTSMCQIAIICTKHFGKIGLHYIGHYHSMVIMATLIIM